MPRRSQRITLRDVRAMSDAAHECCEMWADPPAWQAHLMRRACDLAGCRVGLYFEMADHAGFAANRVVAAHDVGWESDGERHTVVEGLACRPLRYSPLWAAFADVLAVRGRAVPGALTAHQSRVIAAPDWHESEMYERHVRPTRLGEVTLSAVWMPQVSAWNAWSLVTDRGDPAPSPRNRRLVRLLHQRVAPLVGTRLSTRRDRTVAPLSATRRQVLNALLDGLGEPEIAEQSYRSRSAVHEHVTALYRHFDVNSRGELAAFFLRRRPVPAGRAVADWTPKEWYTRAWVDASRGDGND